MEKMGSGKEGMKKGRKGRRREGGRNKRDVADALITCLVM